MSFTFLLKPLCNKPDAVADKSAKLMQALTSVGTSLSQAQKSMVITDLMFRQLHMLAQYADQAGAASSSL